MRKGAWLYLAMVGVATGVYFVQPTSTQYLLYDAIGVSAGLLMLYGVWRNRPEPSAAWLLLALAVLLQAGGDIVFGEGQSVPSLADMLYISAYPLMALALWGMTPSRRSRGRGPSITVAAAIAGLVAIVCWTFLLLPSGTASNGLAAQLVSVGYPVMDVILLGLVARAIRGQGARGPLLFIALALVGLLVADVAYALSNFGNSYSLGAGIDAAWLLSYGLFGAAALYRDPQTDYLFDEQETDVCPAPVAARPAAVLERVERRNVVRETFDQSLRFSVIVSWSGRMLVALAATAVLFGAAWKAVDITLMGGAFALTGSFMWVAGAKAH